MYFSINNKLNLKIREFIHSNINTNLLLKEEEILIKCKDKKLILYSNNLFTESKLTFSEEEVKCKKQGDIILSSKTLLSLLESLKHQPKIEFQRVENSLIKVSSEKFECNLISLTRKFLIEDNLVIPEDSKKLTLEFEFLNLINNRFKDFYRNLGSSLQKNTIYNTINFKKNKSSNEVNVLVTDSYRILFASFSFSDILEEEFQFNLHTEILSCIILLFKDRLLESKKLNFYIKGDSLLVNSEGLIFRTKLNSSNYPNLSNLFKQETQLSFTINKNLLISAIDRNLLLAEQNLHITSYKVLEDNLVLEYRDSSRGFTKEEIKINKHKGENIHFSLNSLFLKQLLKNISDDEIIFNISEVHKPIILFGKNEGINFKQIILPLKYS